MFYNLTKTRFLIENWCFCKLFDAGYMYSIFIDTIKCTALVYKIAFCLEMIIRPQKGL